MWIFTACNAAYAPGVMALGNSIRANFPDGKFCVIYYGEGTTLEADRVVLNHELPVTNVAMRKGQVFRSGSRTAAGDKYSITGPELYARLIVPELMGNEGRALYVDADCLVLGDLSWLWQMSFDGKPTACVSRSRIGWASDPRLHWQDMASGVFALDCAEWAARGLSQQHFNTMAKHLENPIPANVEGLMGHVHGGDYFELSPVYQNLQYWGNLTRHDKILHYADDKPWLPPLMGGVQNYMPLWEAYAANDIARAREIEAALPDERIEGFRRRVAPC